MAAGRSVLQPGSSLDGGGGGGGVASPEVAGASRSAARVSGGARTRRRPRRSEVVRGEEEGAGDGVREGGKNLWQEVRCCCPPPLRRPGIGHGAEEDRGRRRSGSTRWDPPLKPALNP